MESVELYVDGAGVWVPDEEDVWLGAVLLEALGPDHLNGSRALRVRDARGAERGLAVSAAALPPLRNPEILLGKDDLTELSYLHEPAVLYNLKLRFLERELMYTYCGIVLVAVNPYADMRQLYSEEMIQVYLGQGKSVRADLDPHIFAVAEEAVFDLTEYHTSQSLIVSGESGAGKTVSAKLAMRYFAAVSGARDGVDAASIEGRILATNPVMEALGNAKTIRNDNSSRFGKLIKMDFTERKTIAGAQLKTYLLEKSRVVAQARGERNYHIFYQLCSGRDAVPELAGLALADPMRFAYTAMGRCPSVEGMDDLGELQGLLSAFSVLGFSKGEQSDAFRVLAGILHLGNVAFEGSDAACLRDDASPAVGLLCGQLWGLSESELRLWLTTREISAGREVCRTSLSGDAAATSRDALAKLVYESLFGWLVGRLNAVLRAAVPSPDKKRRVEGGAFIGILDIYGFETFDRNSFEQFSINYANEKLQQQFNQHVFKLEQEEYVREGLDWVEVTFADNAPCISLIEDRPGLIELLDEQSKLGSGSDAAWLAQLGASLAASPHFALPKIRAPAFIVRHFASDVLYQTDGFLEKNRDTVSQQLVAVCKNSKFPFLDSILSAQFERSATASMRKKGPGVLGSLLSSAPKAGKQLTKTVATQFRESLCELMEILGSTRPHYIRCVKPNDLKAPFTVEAPRAMEQLRACGVLETVRISAAGFPSRWSYADFGRRYRVLAAGHDWQDKPKHFAETVCRKFIKEGGFGLGHTKMFFRTGQVAVLEAARSSAFDAAALVLQCAWRQTAARKELHKRRAALRLIQAAGRAYLAWHWVHYVRMHRAAVLIQSNWKATVQRKRFTQLRSSVLGIQTLFRGRSARQIFLKAKLERMTVALQARCRGFLARAEARALARKVTLAQCCVRRWLAKRQLRRLKVEARSSNHLLRLNKGLENKVISLQQKMDAKTATETSRIAALEAALAAKEAEVGRLGGLLEKSSGICAELEAELGRREARAEARAAEEAQQRATTEAEKTALAEELDAVSAELSQVSSAKVSLESQLHGVVVAIDGAHAEKEEGLSRAVAAEEELAVYRAAVEAELGSGLLPRGHSSRNSICRSSPESGVRAPDEGIVSNGSSPVGTLKAIPADLVTMLKLQRRLDQLARDKDELSLEVGKLRVLVSARPVAEAWAAAVGTFETLAAQDAQMAAARLEKELESVLAERASLGPQGVDWAARLGAAREENERVREESVMCRAILTQRMEAEAGPGESAEAAVEQAVCLLKQCREQKKVIAAMMEQLDRRDARLKERAQEIAAIRGAPKAELAAFQNGGEGSSSDPVFQELMQQELSRLVSENMVLQSRLESAESSKARLRSTANVDGGQTKERIASTSRDVEPHSGLLHISDPPAFLRLIVYDLKPRLAMMIRPCLPAYLTLLGFRYFDRCGEEEGEVAISTLFTPLHNAIRDIVERSQDLDILLLWLVNSWRLLQLLRQYDPNPTDPAWHAHNTPAQTTQLLSRDFDGSLMREKLESRAQDAYRALLKKAIEPVLSPKIVPAILHHESTREVHSTANGGLRRQDSEERASERALSGLLEFFSLVHSKLTLFGGPECEALKRQVMGQMVEWVGAYAINHLMFNRRLCNFQRAFEIKHNAKEVQDWLERQQLGCLRGRIESVIQATHLLQSRHEMGDIDTLCGDMTSRLKPKQIVTLLEHYTNETIDTNRLPTDFLAAVRSRLRELRGNNNGSDVELPDVPPASPVSDSRQLMVGTHLAPLDTATFAYSDRHPQQKKIQPARQLEQSAGADEPLKCERIPPSGSRPTRPPTD